MTANMSSMLDMSRHSNNTSMTLPGRSRHGGGYGQYPGGTSETPSTGSKLFICQGR